jgi:hypothetical protein
MILVFNIFKVCFVINAYYKFSFLGSTFSYKYIEHVFNF